MENGKEDEIPATNIPEITPKIIPEAAPDYIPEIEPKEIPEIPGSPAAPEIPNSIHIDGFSLT
jgi:hypothetical protein